MIARMAAIRLKRYIIYYPVEPQFKTTISVEVERYVLMTEISVVVDLCTISTTVQTELQVPHIHLEGALNMCLMRPPHPVPHTPPHSVQV